MAGQNSGSEILCRFFKTALDTYFSSDKAAMANALHCDAKALEKALSQEGSRIEAALFEQLMQYCLRNKIGTDVLVQAIKETH